MTAQDFVVGLVMVAVGAMFCFRGAVAMRIVIALWGAFAGFMLGAGAVASSDEAGFLLTTLGWIVGGVLAVVFGALAYLFYQVAVILAMSSIGFAMGTTIMVAFGVTWSWAIVGVGVAAGLLLAVITVMANLSLVLLLVLSAFGGASAIVTGIMLWAGTIGTKAFTEAQATHQMNTSWWWYGLYFGLAVVGMVVQFRYLGSVRGSARDQWDPAPAH